MDAATRQALIDRYAAGPAEVAAAVDGLSDAQLDASPGDGEWSARQVIHHLADSETMASIRLRRLLAEDEPVIQGYDEAEWARRLHYDRPVALSLALLQAVRASNTALLRTLGDADFARGGTHTESGPYTVTTWLDIYARHAHDHADQIRRAAGRA